MGIKDEALDYQRQRHMVLAREASGFDEGGSALLGSGVSLVTSQRLIANAGDGASNAGGTTITVGSAGFADVLVGDYITFGDASPATTRVTARTDTTVTVAAVANALRGQTGQDWAVNRRAGFEAAKFTAEDSVVRHSFPIPSHWDAFDDIELKLQYMATGLTAADTQTFAVQYAAVTPGTADFLSEGLVDLEDGADATHDFDAALDGAIIDLAVPGRIPASAIKKGDWLTVTVSLDDTDATISSTSNEQIFLHAIVFEYTPKLTIGRGADARPYQASDRRDLY